MTARIRWISWADDSGYAVAARRYLRAARTAGLPVVWTPLVPGGGLDPDLGCGPGVPPPGTDPLLLQAYAEGLHPEPDDTVVMHVVPEYFPSLVRRFPARRHVGVTVWETDRLPASWPPLLEACDLIVVPCRFNLDVFGAAGLAVPLALVPHGFDDDAPGPPPPLPATSGDLVFYTIGPWTRRKNLDGLLAAYLDAFTGSDPVLLVLKTTARDQGRRRSRLFRILARTRVLVWLARRRRLNPARVHLLTEPLPASTVAGLHARGDCYVSLTRGEGFGLGAFEAAAAGVPVIMTGWSGHLDYLTPEAAHLVDADLVPVHAPVVASIYTPDQLWAAPRLPHARDLMRLVAADPAAARRRAAPLRERIRREFSDSAIAAALAAALPPP